jgi:hypothetical protein
VGLPKSILINGKGNYYDCEDVYKRKVREGFLAFVCAWALPACSD